VLKKENKNRRRNLFILLKNRFPNDPCMRIIQLSNQLLKINLWFSETFPYSKLRKNRNSNYQNLIYWKDNIELTINKIWSQAFKILHFRMKRVYPNYQFSNLLISLKTQLRILSNNKKMLNKNLWNPKCSISNNVSLLI